MSSGGGASHTTPPARSVEREGDLRIVVGRDIEASIGPAEAVARHVERIGRAVGPHASSPGVAAGEDAAKDLLKNTTKALDKAAKTGLLKKNTVKRTKSRLAKKLNALTKKK